MTNINRAVERFLGWKLPEDFTLMNIYYSGVEHRKGKVLLTADQATEMFKYCLAESREEDAKVLEALKIGLRAATEEYEQCNESTDAVLFCLGQVETINAAITILEERLKL